MSWLWHRAGGSCAWWRRAFSPGARTVASGSGVVSGTAAADTRQLHAAEPTRHRPDYRLALALAAIALLPIVLYLPFLNEPFHADEGLYATAGRMILHGGLPYREVVDNKPPLVFAWYSLSFLLFGEHIWAPRLLVALLACATTLLVYIEGRLLDSTRTGLIAAVSFALSIGLARFDTNANAEYFLLFPLVAGLVCLTVGERTGSLGWYAASGFFGGAAMATKQTILIPFAFLLAWTFLGALRRSGPREPWRRAGAMVFGVGSLGALIALPYILARSLSDFVLIGVVYPVIYVGHYPLSERIMRLLLSPAYPLLVAGPWFVLAASAVVAWLRDRSDRNVGLLVGWLLSLIASIAFVGRFYSHYWAEVLPGLALLVPFGISALVRERIAHRRRVRLAVSLIAVSVVVSMALNGNVYVRASPASRHEAKFPNVPERAWELQSADLAAFIRDHTKPGDEIYNLGYQSELYFYADRNPASRYLSDRFFGFVPGWADHALADLERARPKYIIDSARYETFLETEYDRAPFDRLLTERYDYLGKMWYADVYRLKPQFAATR